MSTHSDSWQRDGEPQFSGPTGVQKVLQLHPTRRCNLRCLHCYSLSGPEVSETLDASILRQAITDAACEGYGVCGFSGGEPLLYRGLSDLLAHAHNLGMRTTVTSNGIPLTPARLEQLRPHLDLLAISLDGVPESHNRMRNASNAFRLMSARLETVRALHVPFGFIFTLTQHNLHELKWVTEFSIQEGAALLQIHPLDSSGRAGETLIHALPDDREMAIAYIEALRAQDEADDRLRIHIDLTDVELLRETPSRGLADVDPDLSAPETWDRPLADLITPLVVQTDGNVVPFQYGFAPAYALGNLKRERLRVLAETWRHTQYPRLRSLCRRVFQELTCADSPPIVNWYNAIAGKAALDKSV